MRMTRLDLPQTPFEGDLHLNPIERSQFSLVKDSHEQVPLFTTSVPNVDV